MSRTVRGGVAKMLLYASESAVRLASRGVRQVASPDATWSFALGAPGCPHAAARLRDGCRWSTE